MAHQAITLRPAATPTPQEAATSCPLLDRMPGESCWYRWRDQNIHYRRLGNGPPLVLVHTPDTGASCMEWRNNIEALAESYSVHAVDLPGYGLSDMRPTAYTADRYIGFLADFLQAVPGTPARVISSILGAGYLVHVADRKPALVDRLLLISPAGLGAYRPARMSRAAFLLMGLPGLSSVFYGSTTSRYAIKEHLDQEVYVDDRFTGPLSVDARHWVSHRLHADCVERSRMAGMLNTCIRGAITRLRQPLMVAWGSHAVKPPFSDMEMIRDLNPRALTMAFDRSGTAPHEEESPRFNKTARAFMEM